MGVLRPLLVRHVITGMNIESLASILQNKISHYDSDVLTHILKAIQFVCLPYLYFFLVVSQGTTYCIQ